MQAMLEEEVLDDELSSQVRSYCRKPLIEGFHKRIHPSGMVMIKGSNLQHAQEVLNLNVRHDDVWVVSFPKSGSVWIQEMVWLLNNNLDFKQARTTQLNKRCPLIQPPDLGKMKSDHTMSEMLDKLSSPRLMRCQLHKELFPRQVWIKKPKIIYIFRDPKDVAISFCHFYSMINNYSGPKDLLLTAFLQDKAPHTPFWKQVLEFWNLRSEMDILFVTYEEMTQDLKPIVKRVARYLQVDYDETKESKLLEHLRFENMKNNPAVNGKPQLERLNIGEEGEGVIRQGVVGGWRKEMSSEMATQFDKWTEENLRGTDFPREFLQKC